MAPLDQIDASLTDLRDCFRAIVGGLRPMQTVQSQMLERLERIEAALSVEPPEGDALSDLLRQQTAALSRMAAFLEALPAEMEQAFRRALGG